MANEEHKRPPVAAIVVIVVLLLAAAGGYAWWRTQQTAANGSLTASGAVESTEYQVAATAAGRIATVTVGEGAVVTAGQALVGLDDTAFRLQVQQAQQGVRAANAQVKSAKNDGTSAEVTAAKARLEQAKAAVRLAEVQLAYATVTSPHGGVVVAVTANAGQNASPGKTLLTITDPSDLFVRVFVPETRIGEVSLGQSVRVAADAGGRDYPGKVEFISAQAEFTPNNVETKDQRAKLVYEVRVRLADKTGTLKPGMPVDVTFE